MIPRRGTKYTAKPEQMLDYWGRMLDVLPGAPLFPLERFADIITKLTSFLVSDPKYPGITERVDQLLAGCGKSSISYEFVHSGR